MLKGIFIMLRYLEDHVYSEETLSLSLFASISMYTSRQEISNITYESNDDAPVSCLSFQYSVSNSCISLSLFL